MTPKFAQAVDPILLHVLELLDGITRQRRFRPTDERIRIRALIDQAEAIVGSGEDWELAKYGLVSWIDEMLVDAAWDGRDWWSNNVMEVELFNTRLCYEQFYVRAQEASTLSSRDALEVFYICVVLGFRGLYRDRAMAEMLAPAHGLPPDLDSWAKQVSMSIRLGQGRPALANPNREIHGAPPLKSRSIVVWPWMIGLMLGAWNVLYYVLFWSKS